jgi:L-ribulose-5-phosphate 4-epimerase
VNGVAHTHSANATAFAQALRPIPCFGTTQADNFYGDIPVTREMSPQEVATDYELNTGRVIVERFRSGGIDPENVPGVLVASHAPFAWGTSPEKAVENAIVLEFAAKMALAGLGLAPDIKPIPAYLLDKHFLRKHGPKAYYGQPKGPTRPI